MYKECPSLYTCCAQIGHWLGHVYISKQFSSLGTPSVTAWTQLVHVCKSVSKLGTPTFTAVRLTVMAQLTVLPSSACPKGFLHAYGPSTLHSSSCLLGKVQSSPPINSDAASVSVSFCFVVGFMACQTIPVVYKQDCHL